MEILVNLDVMMAKRKISAGELAERVGMIQRIDLWVVNGLLAHLASERGRETPVGLVARLAPAKLIIKHIISFLNKNSKTKSIQNFS